MATREELLSSLRRLIAEARSLTDPPDFLPSMIESMEEVLGKLANDPDSDVNGLEACIEHGKYLVRGGPLFDDPPGPKFSLN